MNYQNTRVLCVLLLLPTVQSRASAAALATCAFMVLSRSRGGSSRKCQPQTELSQCRPIRVWVQADRSTPNLPGTSEQQGRSGTSRHPRPAVLLAPHLPSFRKSLWCRGALQGLSGGGRVSHRQLFLLGDSLYRNCYALPQGSSVSFK